MTKTLTTKTCTVTVTERRYSNGPKTFKAIELLFSEKPSDDFIKQTVKALQSDGKAFGWHGGPTWYRAYSDEAYNYALNVKAMFEGQEKPKAKRVPKNSEKAKPVQQAEEKRKPGRPKKEEAAPKTEQPKEIELTECNPMEGYRSYKTKDGTLVLRPKHLPKCYTIILA